MLTYTNKATSTEVAANSCSRNQPRGILDCIQSSIALHKMLCWHFKFAPKKIRELPLRQLP